MVDGNLIKRLASLSGLAHIPNEELEWLIAHGNLKLWKAGAVVAPKGKRIPELWIVISGHIAIRVDRGAGPRRVMEWRTGDVGGMLPYSRMTGPPGDTYIEETTEILLIHESGFTEMIHKCPLFTAHTVHTMIDRARAFNTSDLQDEKMISLGKLAAGLAHELNNPASATMRNAKLLLEDLTKLDAAAREIGASISTDEMKKALEQARAACLAKPLDKILSPIEIADREDEIANWLINHNSDPTLAASLAETAITFKELDALTGPISGYALNAALRWISAGCAIQSLATDIERAATQIHQLVTSIKSFTYMDKLAGPESVDVEAGLRDTLRVVASKAKTKSAVIMLEIEPHLPLVYATGGEINQVWLNLIDNALDAIAESGRISINARRELDRIVVRVVDDGPGIAPDDIPRIFDPFFTTKPPGQGTGLGLDITRRLLRRYHGDISVSSNPGHTEFCVSLLIDKPSASRGTGPALDTSND